MTRRSGLAAALSAFAVLATVLALAASASAESLPDLALARKGPSKVTALAAFTETLRITNRGTASAAGVAVDFEPDLTVQSSTKGVSCSPILKGHSGRGGGYTQVGWECGMTPPAGLAPGATVAITLRVTAPRAGQLTETLTALPRPYQAQQNLVTHVLTAAIAVAQPPLPLPPTALHASRVGDGLVVGWTPSAATAADLTGSTFTATPVGGSSAPVLYGAGSAKVGGAGPAVPKTTYRITVIVYDAAGASAESEAIEYTTAPSTVPPAPPGEVRSWWLSPTAPIGSFLVGWSESPKPGDSAIDEWQIQAVPAEAEVASTLTNQEPAAERETQFTGNSETPWTVRVRAHNAAGWGAWSAPVERGGV